MFRFRVATLMFMTAAVAAYIMCFKVAEEGYRACMKGEVIKVPGIINLATILAGRATPKWLLRKLTGSVGRATVKG